ncbi:MAG: site-2 protease family protein [Chloroflexi bacterium]|nr:site-2 protease family protein [Chloroflexota bacterium]
MLNGIQSAFGWLAGQTAYFFIFVLVVGGLIFFHELGHFLAAVSLKVKIKEFGLGLPPRLLGVARDQSGARRWFFGKPPADVDPDSIIYSINWIPLGGFVRPAGEDDPAVPDGLAASPKRTRFLVLVAGPGANLLIGLIVFTVGYLTGWPRYQIKISDVVADAPAAVAGLQVGDIVLRANGSEVSATNNQLSTVVRENVGKPVTLLIQRDGQPLIVVATPRTEWPADQGPLGVELSVDWTLVKYPPLQALPNAAAEIIIQIRETLMLPVRLIEGQLKVGEVRLVSVVGLKSINDAAVNMSLELGQWFPFLNMIGTITVALALTNLLPLPALDGGRILFVLIEAVRGRRVDPLREGYVHVMGLIVLLAIMALLVINDIVHPIF